MKQLLDKAAALADRVDKAMETYRLRERMNQRWFYSYAKMDDERDTEQQKRPTSRMFNNYLNKWGDTEFQFGSYRSGFGDDKYGFDVQLLDRLENGHVTTANIFVTEIKQCPLFEFSKYGVKNEQNASQNGFDFDLGGLSVDERIALLLKTCDYIDEWFATYPLHELPDLPTHGETIVI